MKMKTIRPSTSFFIIAGCLLAVKLWLVSAQYLQATYTPQDDLLFIRQANSILSGHWLGPYNQMTLIKGPFYPLFIALAYWLAIPLMTAQQLLWWGACIVFVLAIYPAIRSQKLALLLFLFLLMNPFTYYYDATGRVFRLGIYSSLGFLSLSCLCGLIIRDRQSWKRKLCWAAAGGLFFAAFWHTREESIWLVPSLLLVFLFLLLRTYRGGGRKKAVGSLLAIYLVPLLIFSSVTLALCLQNYRHYGLFMTIEVESAPFKSAYGGLLRIKSDQWRRFFPVVADARRKAYAVSPSFAELKPYLEGNLARGWENMAGTKDLPAAFFIWAFRDSVAAAGHYRNSADTMAYYESIGRQIDAACEDGRLDCRPRFTDLIPPWHQEFNKLLLPTWWSIFKRIVSFDECSADTAGRFSWGPGKIMMMYETVTREKLRTSKPSVWRSSPEYNRHLNKEKIRILDDIGKFYSRIVPPLFIAAFIALLCSLGTSLYKRFLPSWACIFGLSALGGVTALSVILTLVAITSYSEITRAMQAAYPMVMFFIIASLYDAWRLWRRRGSRPDDPERWE